MSVQHFKSLLIKYAQIQQKIDKEHQRRLPDWIRLLKLKKIRLAIKDRLVHMMSNGTKNGHKKFNSVRIKTKQPKNNSWQQI